MHTHLDCAVKINAQLHCSDSPHISFSIPCTLHTFVFSVYYSRTEKLQENWIFFSSSFSRHNHTQHTDTQRRDTDTHLHAYRIGIFFRNYQKCYVVVSTITSLIAYVSIFAYACLFDMLFFFLLLCILLSSCQTIFSTTSRCNAWKAAKVLCTRMGMFVYLVVTTLVA